MKLIFVLWLFTSNYAVEIETYPALEACIPVMMALDESIRKPPRAFMGLVACLPKYIITDSGPRRGA